MTIDGEVSARGEKPSEDNGCGFHAGGGGGSGGAVLISAPMVYGAGQLIADGGAGGDSPGDSTGNWAWSGGGGGGGRIKIFGDDATLTATLSATGGSPGAIPVAAGWDSSLGLAGAVGSQYRSLETPSQLSGLGCN